MSHGTILIVDSDACVAQGLTWPLRLSGYGVETCSSAEAALARVTAAEYDLIITDQELPGMSGLELVGRLLSACPRTRLILMTPLGTPRVEARARPAVDAYLPKPFSTKELLEAVRRALPAQPA